MGWTSENALVLRDSLKKLGRAIAARIEITAIVTISSRSVNPDLRSRMAGVYRMGGHRRKRKDRRIDRRPFRFARREMRALRSCSLVRVDRWLGQHDGRVAVGGGAGERVHDLGIVAVEVAGRLRGERRGRAGVVVVEQAVLVDLEVERLPDRVSREARRNRSAVIVRAAAAAAATRLRG